MAWKQVNYLRNAYTYMNQNPAIDTSFNTPRDLGSPEYGLLDLLVEYIVQAYGEGKLPELVRNPTHLEQVFGKSDAALYADWVEYIKLHYLSAVRQGLDVSQKLLGRVLCKESPKFY